MCSVDCFFVGLSGLTSTPSNRSGKNKRQINRETNEKQTILHKQTDRQTDRTDDRQIDRANRERQTGQTNKKDKKKDEQIYG